MWSHGLVVWLGLGLQTEKDQELFLSLVSTSLDLLRILNLSRSCKRALQLCQGLAMDASDCMKGVLLATSGLNDYFTDLVKGCVAPICRLMCKQTCCEEQCRCTLVSAFDFDYRAPF